MIDLSTKRQKFFVFYGKKINNLYNLHRFFTIFAQIKKGIPKKSRIPKELKKSLHGGNFVSKER